MANCESTCKDIFDDEHSSVEIQNKRKLKLDSA